MRTVLVVFLSLTLGGAPAVSAQAAPADTSPPSHQAPFFTYRDAVLAGLFAAGTVAMAPVDVSVAKELQRPTRQESRFLQRTFTFFRFMGQPAPQIIGVGLYGLGRLTHNVRMTRLAVHGSEAMLLGTAATSTIKLLAGRGRPYFDPNNNFDFGFGRGLKGTKYQSFPSGHATTAFSVAAAATAEFSHWVKESGWPQEYKLLVGGVLFGGASMVGVSRIYNNYHWASDVVTGAAIGTFSGIKIVRYNYRHPQNRVERFLVKATLVPAGAGAPTRVFLSIEPTSEP
ncbi:MAG TPA: phosphatase PAP2 family protein [Longimicrobiales bacterium]|nr:phosphatase PAP2 family protein [Longimicrobiales bacterium]